VVVPCSGEYNPVLSTRQEYETLKLNFVDVLLEQTQGGHALASTSYWHGGRYASSLRLAPVGRLIRATHASPLRGAALRQHLAPIRPASPLRCALARNLYPSDRLSFVGPPVRATPASPKRYHPKDGWVRLRPVANPGYRFVNWETAALIFKAIGVGSDRRIWRGSAF
jgi:hypothetical protein